MADASNTSVGYCLICLRDDRELMPCPVKNTNCPRACLRCLIPAIDNDQREPMRCHACNTETTIKDYSTALGFENYTLVTRNQPEIAAPDFFNEEPMDTANEVEVPDVLEQRKPFCLICKENDSRELMPCPAKNTKCQRACLSCLIPTIDNDQRKPMRCQACHKETTIKDYLTVIGIKNHTLMKRNQPEINLSAIAFPLCMNAVCDIRQGSDEPTIGCMTPGCGRIFHKCCLLYFSLQSQGFACSECRVFYTYIDWVNHTQPPDANESSGSDSDMN